MSAGIQDSDSIYERTDATTVGLEAIVPTDAGTDLANSDAGRSTQCVIVACYNDTTLLGAGNYSEISECALANLTADYSTWKVNYTYTYLADEYGTADTINNTISGIASVTDWFDIFIVISAMVVLILLTVIIITAIRSSGMITGDSGGANRLGTA